MPVVLGFVTVPVNQTCYQSAMIDRPLVEFFRLWPVEIVVIPWEASRTEQKELLQSCSALVFQPGGLRLTPSDPYYQTLAFLTAEVQRYNDAGLYYPLFAICLGMQALTMILGGRVEFGTFDADHYLTSLIGVDHKSEFFRGLLTPTTQHLHCDGVLPGQVPDNLLLTALSRDRRGRIFVSNAEGVHYPFFLSQWHPERSPLDRKAWSGRYFQFASRNPVSTPAARLLRERDLAGEVYLYGVRGCQIINGCPKRG